MIHQIRLSRWLTWIRCLSRLVWKLRRLIHLGIRGDITLSLMINLIFHRP